MRKRDFYYVFDSRKLSGAAQFKSRFYWIAWLACWNRSYLDFGRPGREILKPEVRGARS